jgi:hypothetical protein
MCLTIDASPQPEEELMTFTISRDVSVALRDSVGFIAVTVGVLVMIAGFQIDTEPLLTSAYVVGVYALWRTNAVLNRVASRTVGGTEPLPDGPPTVAAA